MRLTFCCSILLISLFTAGCAKPVHYMTPSGRPEVSIVGSVAKDVRGDIIGFMMGKGYSMTNETSSMLVFERAIDNAFAAALYGSRYDGTPNARITYNVYESNDTTTIIANFAIVTNPGSGFERITPANGNKDTMEYMQFLESLKTKYSS